MMRKVNGVHGQQFAVGEQAFEIEQSSKSFESDAKNAQDRTNI